MGTRSAARGTRDGVAGAVPVSHSPAVAALVFAALIARIVSGWLPGLAGLIAFLAMAALELVVLRLARGRLAELWVTRRRLLPALLAGLLTWPLSLAFALAYALHRLGHFAWMPLSEYPSTIGNALFFPLTEELLFRGLLLSLLVAWGVRPWAANLLAATLFVLAHPRYLLVIPGYSGPTRPDVWLAAMVLAVGLLAGAVALRYRNVWGAVVVHAGANFLIFVPIGAVIKSL